MTCSQQILFAVDYCVRLSQLVFTPFLWNGMNQLNLTGECPEAPACVERSACATLATTRESNPLGNDRGSQGPNRTHALVGIPLALEKMVGRHPMSKMAKPFRPRRPLLIGPFKTERSTSNYALRSPALVTQAWRCVQGIGPCASGYDGDKCRKAFFT